MEIEGIIKVINDEQQVSPTFKKREMVVTTAEQYPQHILIEFNQDKCNLVDNRSVGDKVKVHINIRGRMWEDKTKGVDRYFNTIQGWKIELLGQGTAPVAQAAPAIPATENDEAPF